MYEILELELSIILQSTVYLEGIFFCVLAIFRQTPGPQIVPMIAISKHGWLNPQSFLGEVHISVGWKMAMGQVIGTSILLDSSYSPWSKFCGKPQNNP